MVNLPQTDGQSERTIQMLEDMLRARVLDPPRNWDRNLPSGVCWYGAGETSMLGPELTVETSEQIKQIRAKILTAQSRQKSYAGQRRKPLEFREGNHIFLKVTLTTGIGRAIKT